MKQFNRSAGPQDSKGGFALVITLIMVVLAAILAIGLLVNASSDRTTAKSVDDRFKAEVAAQNAFETAKKALSASPTAASPITGDDSFLVVRIDAPAISPTPAPNPTPASYYFLAKAQAGNANKIDYYPLFAGGSATLGAAIDLSSPAPVPPATALTRPTPPPNPDPNNPADAAIALDKAKNITKVYPSVSPWIGAPSTKWIDVHDPNDTAIAAPYTLPYQRYTYWVEDLGGYIDASVAGNTADGGKNKRPLDQSSLATRYQTTPGELALFTIFDPIPQQDDGKTAAQYLIDPQNRPLQFTVESLKQIAQLPSTSDLTSPYLATRLQADSEVPLVPFGYGYKDEGDVANQKLNINPLVQSGGDAAVQAIAKKITDNLPNFGNNRKGGLTNLDYVKTIAASMVDYADSDSNATLGPDYRGYDSYPLVSEIYSSKNYKTITQQGTYWVTITVEWWVEIWNMSNQPSSGAVSFNFNENHPIQIGFYTYNFGYTPSGSSPVSLPNGSTVTPTYPAGALPLQVSMAPNEYKVLNVRTDTFKFNTGVSPPDSFPSNSPSPSPLPLTANATSAAPITSNSPGSTYEMTWSASPAPAGSPIVDRSSTYGVVRVSGSLDGPHPTGLSNRNWRGSLPGFVGNNPDGGGLNSSFYDTIGDPRLAYYWGCPQSPNAYIRNSSMGARNIRGGITVPPSSPNYKEVKPTSWPDRGHDGATITAAAAPSTATKDPPASPTPTPEPSKAPATISNTGSYATTAELGNVYDPAQWNITPDANNRWSDITSSTSADANYGGGMTLRMGRPEFTRFDQPGLRAWQLLDLFSVGSRINTRGLMNINTASRDTLRTLGAGILLNRDPALLDASNNSITSLYPPYISKQADVFADAVIAARPFLSPAQLSAVRTASGSAAAFGDPQAWPPAPPPPGEWNDSGTEENFAKIFPLVTTHSRNFRVFVTGQSMDKNGNVLSTVSKVFQVYLNPTRDPATGKINSQKVEIKYEAHLPL